MTFLPTQVTGRWFFLYRTTADGYCRLLYGIPRSFVTSGTKVAAKYRDPTSGTSWTGRELKPKWVTSALATGKSPGRLQDLTPAFGDRCRVPGSAAMRSGRVPARDGTDALVENELDFDELSAVGHEQAPAKVTCVDRTPRARSFAGRSGFLHRFPCSTSTHRVYPALNVEGTGPRICDNCGSGSLQDASICHPLATGV